jgi:hypothetical protein
MKQKTLIEIPPYYIDTLGTQNPIIFTIFHHVEISSKVFLSHQLPIELQLSPVYILFSFFFAGTPFAPHLS